jgi:hypothetical protein
MHKYFIILHRRSIKYKLGRDGVKILTCIFSKWNGGGGMVWIYLAQDTDRWQALVNTVMNLWVP